MTTLTQTNERADLLEEYTTVRRFLLFTAQELTDEQARLAPTVSTLSIGGIIKHVAMTDRAWAGFVRNGAAGMDFTPERAKVQADSFVVGEGETLASLVEAYEANARETEEIIRTVDLDADHALPNAPWFPADGRWTNRKALTHIIAETAHHAGHADIVRETIDGQKTMG